MIALLPDFQPSGRLNFQSPSLKRHLKMSICRLWPRRRRHASLSSGPASPGKMVDSVSDIAPFDASLGSEGYIFTVAGKRYIAPPSKKVRSLTRNLQRRKIG